MDVFWLSDAHLGARGSIICECGVAFGARWSGKVGGAVVPAEAGSFQAGGAALETGCRHFLDRFASFILVIQPCLLLCFHFPSHRWPENSEQC